MHDLAVGIINWKTRELTLACLASLVPELARLNLDATVWVVDNASDDGSSEAIAREFPQVVLVRNSENVGFARANNQFLRTCEARHYLLLNSDTVVREGALVALLAEIARLPDAGAVGPRLRLGDGTVQRSYWPLPSLGGELRYNLVQRFPPFGSLFKRLFLRRLPDIGAVRQTIPVEVLSMACLLIDRRVLARVGLLAEDCFLFGEENDLFVRMSRTEWRGYYVPTALVTHFAGQSRGREHARQSEAHFFRSRTRYFMKYHPEVGRRYRWISAFFLNWSLAIARVRLAFGFGEREQVTFYRELKSILHSGIAPVPGAQGTGGHSTC